MYQVNINKKNLFLIGMMGSWKSTVGKQLSKALNMKFIDTDDCIEDMMEMKIIDIFEEFGEHKFRQMESAFFIEKAKQNGHVFSTGGGIILKDANREILKNGITILLDASSKNLADRINNTNKRPLLLGTGDLEARIKAILIERNKYYLECAQLIIDTNELIPKDVVSKILSALKVSNENN